MGSDKRFVDECITSSAVKEGFDFDSFGFSCPAIGK
jgi:hypothetical protein